MIEDRKKNSITTVDTMGKYHCCAHLTILDNYPKSFGLLDMDMETLGTHHHLDSHSLCYYIWSVESLVATVDTKCHNLGSTQGSDRSTQPAIKEGSVATVDTFGKCHNLRFTRGSDGLVHTTLQDGPGKTVDTAPGELTHQDGSERTLRGNYCHEEHSKVCHGITNDNTEGDTVLTVEVKPSVIITTEVDNCDSISDYKT